jgi:hypothetical protein
LGALFGFTIGRISTKNPAVPLGYLLLRGFLG